MFSSELDIMALFFVAFQSKWGSQRLRGVGWSPNNIGFGFQRDNSGQGQAYSNTTPRDLHF